MHGLEVVVAFITLKQSVYASPFVLTLSSYTSQPYVGKTHLTDKA